MFRSFFYQVFTIIHLAALQSFKREEMVITLNDIQSALHECLHKNDKMVVMCKNTISFDDKAELYVILYNAFGPDINITKEAFECLHNIVYTWHCTLKQTLNEE